MQNKNLYILTILIPAIGFDCTETQPMESLIVESRNIFAQILAEHHNHLRRWHYAVLLSTNNRNSLASLLDISYDDYVVILKNLQLITTSKDGKRKGVLKEKWEQFIINESIGEGVYFDKANVKSFSTYNDKGATKDRYNNMWIGLGTIKGKAYSPVTQFKRFPSPPRRTKDMNILIKS